MEGRAIARPNDVAEPEKITLIVALQWRAGQLPGQTSTATRQGSGQPRPFNGGPGNCPAKLAGSDTTIDPDPIPSMEGRAIARPNVGSGASSIATHCLQWRAGQLPGQTAEAVPA